MSLLANSKAALEQLTESLSINSISFILPHFKILHRDLPFISKQQTHKNQQIKSLKNIIRLFILVTE